jgi:glucose/arabinose dehydrogenase
MRRTTAILTVSLCAVAGCRGGGAQEPYDGMLAAAQRPAVSVPAPAAQTAEPEVVPSEVDVPWAIALLSDAKAPGVRKAGNATVVDVQPEVSETVIDEADLRVAIDPTSAEERPATPKTCRGVVKSRS